MILERNSSVCMYEQIVGILKDEILQKRVAPDGCLGTHKELAERYNVSLITIRKALQVLEEQGIVEIKQGKGTFVSRSLLANRLNFFTSYVDVLGGVENTDENTRLLTMESIKTPASLPPHVCDMLGNECFFFERIHFLDDQVKGYARAFLPQKYGRLLTLETARKSTTYELYTRIIGVQLGKGLQRIRAIPADQKLSGIFHIDEGTPLVFIERESYSAQGELLELLELYSQYSQYEYTISLD